MNICFEVPELHQPSAVALGTFDGLHLGHREVVGQMVKQAEHHQIQPWVFTFKNHPAHVLRPDKAPRLLTTWQEKMTLLQKNYALNGVVLLSFDRDFSHVSPEDFVSEILVKQMKVKHITVGYNFHFGYQARGDAQLLQDLSKKHDYALTVVPAYQMGDESVSSTRIRKLLSAGLMEPALALLGGEYLIQGKVIRGQGIAAKVLEVPTANLEMDQSIKHLPDKGVYACTVRRAGDEKIYNGVMNLGIRPTFAGGDLSLEVYLMDFEGDLYGEVLEVFFKSFLRPEKKFDGPEALKQQIHRDIHLARQVLQMTVS